MDGIVVVRVERLRCNNSNNSSNNNSNHNNNNNTNTNISDINNANMARFHAELPRCLFQMEEDISDDQTRGESFYAPPHPGSNFRDCKCARIETSNFYTPPLLGGGV